MRGTRGGRFLHSGAWEHAAGYAADVPATAGRADAAEQPEEKEKNDMGFKPVKIGDRRLDAPIIQGGMGIGVSRSGLAGAVAREGGMGVISAAQVGYDDPGFRKDPEEANLRALREHILRAKELAEGNGMVAVNLMAVTQLYGDYVKVCAEAGADAIISGAGLPSHLPKYAEGYDICLAPIVSSEKSARVILKTWDRKYQRTADFLIIEGPLAGGHLGFSQEELENSASLRYDEEIQKILALKEEFEEKYKKKIPVFSAGGVFSAEDVRHQIDLGCDGVQVASRFVATQECDASQAYKDMYLTAEESDVVIIKSPVGMPGRAIKNDFIRRVSDGTEKITWCFNCLKACNPKTADYCITQALIDAVKGDQQNGLFFCGARVGEIREITTVKALMEELMSAI